MSSDASEIVGIGEILWDILPAGRQLGGAPFNFTYHAHQLAHASAMVSRVGTDALGLDICDAVRHLGLSDAHLQRDRDHPTGTVQVAIGDDGQPTYTITPDVAYDFLAWDDRLAALVAQARVVCFGTLAQRHPVARATLQQALRRARLSLVVYDVNLRQDFYDHAVIEQSLQASRWVKLNEDELRVLRQLLGLAGATDAAVLEDLRRRHGLELAALTRGERGCLVRSAQEVVDIPGVPTAVVDTIGAGDAFTAGLVVQMLEGAPLATAASFANRLAARVAGSAGGTPVVKRSEIE